MGWSVGTAGIVTTLEGYPGGWAVLGGTSDVLIPNQLRKPLPQNFSISYELILSGTKWVAAPGFSNNKKYNHIRVAIKKIGETMQVFIDDNKIVEYEKAIPSGLLFNAMSFTLAGSHGENDKFYISNIKIIKE